VGTLLGPHKLNLTTTSSYLDLLCAGNEESYTGYTALGTGNGTGTCGSVFSDDTWEIYGGNPAVICPYHTDILPMISGTYQYTQCTDMFVVKFDNLFHYSNYDWGSGNSTSNDNCTLNLEMALYIDGSVEIRYFDMCTAYDDDEAVTLQAENGLNAITVCGPDCTCWDGYGGNYQVRIIQEEEEEEEVFCSSDSDCGSNNHCYCPGEEEEAARRRRKLRASSSRSGSFGSKNSRRKKENTPTGRNKGKGQNKNGGFGAHSVHKDTAATGGRQLLFTADSCYCVQNEN